MVLNYRQLSFTSQLNKLEDEVLNHEEYSDEVQQSLQCLITYLESGSITSSKVNKFILKNFRLSLSDMLALWNDNEDIFKEKSMDTLRGQVSELSSQLYEIFGDISMIYSSQSIYCNNEDLVAKGKQGISEINKRLHMLQMREVVSIDDAVIPQLYYSFLSDELTPEYIPPEELRKEIALIKFLTKKNIFDLIEKVDIKKLVYIRRVLNKELITAKNKFFNTTKLELLEEFEKVSTHELNNSDSKFGVPVMKEEAEIKLHQLSTPKKIEDDYEFASMSELIKVILDYQKEEPDYSKSTPKRKSEFQRLLSFYTVEGLRTCIENFNPTDVDISHYKCQ